MVKLATGGERCVVGSLRHVGGTLNWQANSSVSRKPAKALKTRVPQVVASPCVEEAGHLHLLHVHVLHIFAETWQQGPGFGANRV